MKVEQTFEVQGMTTRPFVVDEKILVDNPRLWWPYGYGDPNLYAIDFTIEVDGKVSDAKTVTFGIREYDYEFVNDNIIIKVNGERILPAIMNDNYFTLMPGEYKDAEIEFRSSLLPDNKYRLVVTPCNN